MVKRVVKRTFFILLIIIVAVAAAGLFLIFHPSFGRGPSAEEKSEYEKRTDAFYDGRFHSPEDVRLIVENEQEEGEREAEISDLTVTGFGHSASLLQIH